MDTVVIDDVNILRSDIGLTAYTIGALVEAGLSPTDTRIQSGLRFILPTNSSILEALDSYSLWLVANTLTLVNVNHWRLAEILRYLNARRRGDSGMRFWSDSVVGAPISAGDIETTAYALMTLAKLGKIDESVEITRWLTQQRNGKGGFLSTQDTVCGLQALATISEILYARTGKFHVRFEAVNDTKEFNLDTVRRGAGIVDFTDIAFAVLVVLVLVVIVVVVSFLLIVNHM